MKAKKLPKKNSGTLFQDEQTLSKPGVKLSKQKRFKKPSIYDSMDNEADEELFDESEELFDDELDEDEDQY